MNKAPDHKRDVTPASQVRTLALSEEDVAAAQRVLAAIVGSDGESAQSPSQCVPGGGQGRAELIARARQVFESRRRRAHFFGRAMFGEPAWDMLLALYLLEPAGPRQTIGSVLKFSGASATTAMRWLDYLSEKQLIRRETHPTDRRTAVIQLTSAARDALDLYFYETASD